MSAESAQNSAAVGAAEFEEGRVFAILSYGLAILGLPFWILPLVLRNNEFSLFHAKQCMMLWIVGAVGAAVAGLLTLVLIGVVLLPVLLIGLLVLDVIGLVGAINGEMKPLPIIGKYAVEWFKGVRKSPA
jgi:uncharacterized membrane protein